MTARGAWPPPPDPATPAIVAQIADQSEAYWAVLDARSTLTAAERLDAYEQAKAAHLDAFRAEREGTGSLSAVKATGEELRLAFAGWTSAPDDGTVTPEQIRDARAAGAAKRSRDLREAGRR
jgi:hypothetical protein